VGEGNICSINRPASNIPSCVCCENGVPTRLINFSNFTIKPNTGKSCMDEVSGTQLGLAIELKHPTKDR
jgi:hypothetical protein